MRLAKMRENERCRTQREKEQVSLRREHIYGEDLEQISGEVDKIESRNTTKEYDGIIEHALRLREIEEQYKQIKLDLESEKKGDYLN